MDSRKISLTSSLSPTAAPFVSKKQESKITPSRYRSDHQLTQSLPIASTAGIDIELHCSKSSTPPSIPKFFEEDLATHLTNPPHLAPLAPLIDLLAQSRESSTGSRTFPGSSSTYGNKEFLHQSVNYCDTMASPRLLTYSEATGCSEGAESQHMWISQDDVIRSTEVMPRIPAPYSAEVKEGRALYVIGIPPSFSTQAFKNLFKMCGKIDKCPSIIDLNSEETFRWVIMKTAKEANIVLEARNGMSLPYRGKEWTIWICKALPPGKNFVLGGNWPLERFFKGDVPYDTYPDAPTIHGHPDPPEQPKAAQLAPIPTILLPSSAPIREEPKEEEATSTPSLDLSASTEVTVASSQAVAAATSWANIASAVNEELKTINLRTETKPNAVVSRLNSTGRIPSVKISRNAESLADQARVIFLLELPQNMTLSDISDGIKEGPLHTIRFGTNEDTKERYAGIIFQHAGDAEAFYQVCSTMLMSHKVLQKERIDRIPGRFRFIVEVRRSEEPFPADDIIKMMGPPTCATRRLTIVKSRLFFIFKEPKLRALCEKEVGAGAIQLIWLYNGGNATVVFAKVEDAVAVKKRLDALGEAAEPSSHFFGLQTTFSKDPCVQEIHFITDLHD